MHAIVTGDGLPGAVTRGPARHRHRRRDRHGGQLGSMQGPNIDAAKYVRPSRSTRSPTAPGSRSSAAATQPSARSPTRSARLRSGRRARCPSRGQAVIISVAVGRHRDEHVAAPGRPGSSRTCRRWTQRHAILLTDGRNESEPREELLQRDPARALPVRRPWGRVPGGGCRRARDRAAPLGTVDLIANPADIAEDFRQLVAASMSKGVSSLRRQGCGHRTPRRVAPSVEDLTGRPPRANALTGASPWRWGTRR